MSDKIEKTIEDIHSVGTYSFADQLKNQSMNDIRGGLIGAGLGVLVGISLRKNIYLSAVVGSILGYIVLKK